MASKKGIKSKKAVKKINEKPQKKPVAVEAEEGDPETDVIPAKGAAKKPLVIDPVDILPETDEKLEDDAPLLVGTDEEESEEGPSLDAEELNPFGDKWEE